jgi:hypothetical protein
MVPFEMTLFLKPGAGGSGVILCSGAQRAGVLKVTTVSGLLPTRISPLLPLQFSFALMTGGAVGVVVVPPPPAPPHEVRRQADTRMDRQVERRILSSRSSCSFIGQRRALRSALQCRCGNRCLKRSQAVSAFEASLACSFDENARLACSGAEWVSTVESLQIDDRSNPPATRAMRQRRCVVPSRWRRTSGSAFAAQDP